ncbi:MAG: hypothetical protein WDZ91_16610 [Paenibacillaceae bacterium]
MAIKNLGDSGWNTDVYDNLGPLGGTPEILIAQKVADIMNQSLTRALNVKTEAEAVHTFDTMLADMKAAESETVEKISNDNYMTDWRFGNNNKSLWGTVCQSCSPYFPNREMELLDFVCVHIDKFYTKKAGSKRDGQTFFPHVTHPTKNYGRLYSTYYDPLICAGLLYKQFIYEFVD